MNSITKISRRRSERMEYHYRSFNSTGTLQVQSANPNLVPVVVLFKVSFQRFWELQLVYTGVRVEGVTNGGASEELERKGISPVHCLTEHWLKKHAGGGVFVVLHKAWDVGRHEDTRVMTVKTKLVVLLLYSCMQASSIPRQEINIKLAGLMKIETCES